MLVNMIIFTGEDVLIEKGLLEKATANKRFEYSALCSELKKQTDIAKKQYHGLEKIFIYLEKALMQLIKYCQRKNIINQIFSTEINLLFSNTTILKNLLIFHLFQNKKIQKSLRLDQS